MPKPKPKSQELSEELEQARKADPILDWMIKKDLDLDRETYVALAYLDRDLQADPLTAEEEAQIPQILE